MRSPSIARRLCRRRTLTTGALVLAAACGPRDTWRSAAPVRDSAAGIVDLPSGSRMPEGTMAGTMLGGPNESPARDANQAYLRLMVDRYEGVIAMSDTLLARAGNSAAATDARALRERQEEEQQAMQRFLAGRYDDQHVPAISAADAAMADSVRAAPARYYRLVVAHHREGLELARQMIPQLSGEVLAMAERLMQERAEEVAAFEEKGGGERE